MRSTPETGMVVVLKMDENSPTMPKRFAINKVVDNEHVQVAGVDNNGRLYVEPNAVNTACFEKYSKKRYKDGI